jgi:hypothetical protein
VPEQADLVKFVRLTTEDLVADSPNIAESKLETLVFEKIEKTYGSATWWKAANFTKFDGTYEVSEPALVKEVAPLKATMPESVSEKTPIAASSEKVSTNSYEIKSGNTLGGIIENNFKDKLSSIPVGARGAALDVLYEKLNGKPEVLAEMGIRSGDVDLIYSGEKIDLSVLERELDRVIDRQNIIEQFKTGQLNIEGDNEIKSVQIKTPDSIPLDNEVVPSANNITTPLTETVSSEPTSVNKAVSHVKPESTLSDYELNRAVATSVKNFEAKTYDPFDNLLGSYQSPYAELRSMTLRDFSELRKADGAEIKSYLSDHRIKYETYLAWTNKIDELTKNLPSKLSTTIEDLVVSSVREEVLSRTNTLT